MDKCPVYDNDDGYPALLISSHEKNHRKLYYERISSNGIEFNGIRSDSWARKKNAKPYSFWFFHWKFGRNLSSFVWFGLIYVNKLRYFAFVRMMRWQIIEMLFPFFSFYSFFFFSFSSDSVKKLCIVYVVVWITVLCILNNR